MHNPLERLIATAEEFRDLDDEEPGLSALPDGKHGVKQGKRRMTQAEILLAYTAEWELLRAADGTTYASWIDDGVRVTRPILGRSGVTSYFLKRYADEYGRPPSAEAVRGAVAVLDARAQESRQETDIAVRVAGNNRTVWIDLADADHNVVEIDAAGWRITRTPAAYFRRVRGQLPLPIPERGGSLDDLRPLLNLAGDDDWILTLVWLLGALMPSGSVAHLAISGEQGSAKTSMARILRRLIDPNVAQERAAPRDERDLMIAALNTRIITIDNVSKIQDWTSDALCRLATGGALATRELYSDRDETIIAVRRPAIMTGIGDYITRPDLMDRCITVTLAPIPDAQRRTEREIDAHFSAIHARVLGALCNAVSMALRRRDDVSVANLPRLADLAIWAEAAAPSLGVSPGRIVDVLSRARHTASLMLLEQDPVASAICTIVASNRRWEGTLTELLHTIRETGSEDDARYLPASPRWLSTRLDRLAPELRRAGIDIARRRTNKGTMVTITAISIDEPDDRPPPQKEHETLRPPDPKQPDGGHALIAGSGALNGAGDGRQAARESDRQRSSAPSPAPDSSRTHRGVFIIRADGMESPTMAIMPRSQTPHHAPPPAEPSNANDTV